MFYEKVYFLFPLTKQWNLKLTIQSENLAFRFFSVPVDDYHHSHNKIKLFVNNNSNWRDSRLFLATEVKQRIQWARLSVCIAVWWTWLMIKVLTSWSQLSTNKITVKIVCFFESFIVSKDRKSQGLVGQLENDCFQLSIWMIHASLCLHWNER